jgi:hypothetical protein
MDSFIGDLLIRAASIDSMCRSHILVGPDQITAEEYMALEAIWAERSAYERDLDLKREAEMRKQAELRNRYPQAQ